MHLGHKPHSFFNAKRINLGNLFSQAVLPFLKKMQCILYTVIFCDLTAGGGEMLYYYHRQIIL